MATSEKPSLQGSDEVDGLDFALYPVLMKTWKDFLPLPQYSDHDPLIHDTRSALYTLLYYANTTFKLPDEDEAAVYNWIDAFIAAPSLAQKKTRKSDVQVKDGIYRGWRCASTTPSALHALSRAGEFERSFMKDLYELSDAKGIPRHTVGTERNLKRFYRFDDVRYWLAERTVAFHQKLGRLADEEIPDVFDRFCTQYRRRHEEFMQVKSQLLALTAQEQLDDEVHLPFSMTFLWRWLLIFQMIGEHLHFGLSVFPQRLGHLRHHPEGGIGHDLEVKLGQSLHNLPRDWASNDGLKGFRSGVMGRCPSDEAFIATFSEAKLSTLQLQVQIELTQASSDTGSSLIDELQECFRDNLSLHAKCTATKCSAAQLETKFYKPKHVLPGCDCMHIGPDVSEVKKAIDSSKIKVPLIRISEDENGEQIIRLEVVPRTRNTQYIAISHVWSDGRGNNNENKLPKCQLEHIYDICGLARGLPVWMDTLCIPVGKSVDDKEHRLKAISTMNDIYLHASEVIVICDDLLRLDYTPKMDIWLAFRTCSWMRRGWTLQEGAFGGKNLYIRFRDRLVYLHNEPFLWPPFRIDSPVFEFTMTLSKMFSRIQEATETSLKTAITISYILKEFKWRRTQWSIDEPVIFAGLLGLDPAPLLKVDYRLQTGDTEGEKGARCLVKRLKLLYERIHEFPTNVLYSRVSRLSLPGLGWAPRTFRIDDWTEPETFQGGFNALSRLTGLVRPDGIDFWAHLILIDVGGSDAILPEQFNIKLQMKESHRQHGDTRLSVSLLDFEVDHDHPFEKFDVFGDENGATGNAQTFFRSHPKPKEPSHHYAVVLKGFNQDMAFKDDLDVEAALVKVTDGIDYYKSSNGFHPNESLLSWTRNKLKTWVPLHGTYVRPARLRSWRGNIDNVSERPQFGEFVERSEDKGKGKGKQLPRADHGSLESGHGAGEDQTESEQTALLASGSAMGRGTTRRRKPTGPRNNTVNRFDTVSEPSVLHGLYCNDAWNIVIG